MTLTACDAFDFDSKHSKLLLVDREKLILTSADPKKSNNWKVSNKEKRKGQLEIAATIEGNFEKTLIPHLYSLNKDFKTTFDSLKFKHGKENKNGEVEALLISKNALGMFNRTSTKTAPAKQAMLHLLSRPNEAKTIMTPNLNDSDIIEAIARTVEQGNEVSIYIPKYRNHFGEDLPTMGGSNEKTIKKVTERLKGKIPDKLKIFYTMDGDKNFGSKERLSGEDIHLKFMRSGDYVLMGSSNMDKQSTYNSEECDVIFKSKQHAEQYTDQLLTDIKDKSFLYNDIENNLKADLINLYDEYRKSGKTHKVALRFPSDIKKSIKEIADYFNKTHDSLDFIKQSDFIDFKQRALDICCKADRQKNLKSDLDKTNLDNEPDTTDQFRDDKLAAIKSYISKPDNLERLSNRLGKNFFNDEFDITDLQKEKILAKSIIIPRSKILNKLSQLLMSKNLQQLKEAFKMNTSQVLGWGNSNTFEFYFKKGQEAKATQNEL
ncbi:phospholipase D-like domain-containing protein [Cysteiniphilum litorale]|uniref:Phospholipase D-like domain-containing protein n=1 Tax=Cysteiniphilum litorale TaxID=2056700 RepID=A0A8J2Z6B0_9GAMM|nr:phospholipase D-like domain-containing protein [Cysteiniphilum litorale]GGG05380.1 hypothetical protein GCM10010995_23600 [Cysteiniphilum litorale]